MENQPTRPNATLREAAQFLMVCEKTVLNFADRKVLTPVRLGRRRFFKWSELERLAKRGAPSPGRYGITRAEREAANARG